MTATGLKPPPRFVTNQFAWEHTLAKLTDSGKVDEHGNPLNYAAAAAIYKATVRKYGDMDNVPPAFESTLATRSEILELESEDWTISRGSAWSWGAGVQRIRPNLTYREARHPLNPNGQKVVEPLALWQFEIATESGEPKHGLLTSVSALYLTRQSKAQEWVRGQIESMVGDLDEEIASLDANLLEIGGIDLDTRFFDPDGTKALFLTKRAELEEALAHG